ncbi:MAG: RagB/SusD family nutrient uptake outer membrane protein [Muribaculaceae bacterium]
MKKYILYSSILAIAASMASCNDALDKDPLDRFINNPAYWSNPGNVDGQCNAFYEEFLAYGNAGGGGLYYFKTLNDDQASNTFADWANINPPSASSDWRNPYEEIRRANIIIDGVKSSSLDEKTKNHYLGIARLMRAWEHYQLVRMYGDVQWIEKYLDITDTGILYGKRDKRDLVMDKVLADLDFACANINEAGSKIVFTRQMANAVKADICLYEGTFRKYRSTADNQDAPDKAGSDRFLNACKDACTYVMGKGFKLNDSYQGNYNSPETDILKNPEMIFVKVYKMGTLSHSLIDYTCSSTQISGMTKDAFESYLFTDGKPLALTTLDKNDAGKLDADGNINISEQLALRDKRLSETVDPIVFYNGNTWTRTADGMEMTSSTGYGIKKYDNLSIPTKYRNQTGSNYTSAPVFWLSTVLLDYAEACAELGTISQGDLDKSINLLNARAGLPNLSVAVGFHDPANDMGVSDLIWEVRRARRCELMFDNWVRYWDLIRWHQLDKLDSTKNPDILIGANIKNDPKPDAKLDKKGDYIDGSKGKTRTFDKKQYLYPIPTGQITLNPNLAPNNPGW